MWLLLKLTSCSISLLVPGRAGLLGIFEKPVASYTIMDSLDRDQQYRRRKEVLDWLRCADPTVKHHESRELHQSGSNHWVLELDQFKAWRNTTGQSLWLHGIPGAGKTSRFLSSIPLLPRQGSESEIDPLARNEVMCSTIIHHIEEYCKTTPGSRLAYYYFNFGDQVAQKLDTVLRCLIGQLCEYDEYLPEATWQLYEACNNGRKRPSDQVLADTLFNLLIQDPTRRSFLIVDALDECPFEARKHFFELIIDRIEQHQKATPRCYNFLFTSRNEPDIESRMTRLGVKLHNVTIDPVCVDEDIRLHVAHFISNHRTMKDWPQNLKAEIEETIAGGADGM